MMDALGLIVVVTFVVVGGAIFATGAVVLKALEGVRRQRLEGVGPEASSVSVLRWQTARTGWQRLVERLGHAAAPRDRIKLSKAQQRLTRAGHHHPGAAIVFRGTKIGLAILFGVTYPLAGLLLQRVVPALLVGSLFFAAAGFIAPELWLRRRTAARQGRIAAALPDTLDLLTVCVEAGMGFDAALARVAEQPEMVRSPLHEEILRMNLEVRAGRPRPEALRAFAERCGVRDVTTMVSIFIQTDRLGSSIAKTLRVHSETARMQRRHRAEEQAYLAPLKMIFPTIIFMMPAFILVAMGPSLLAIMKMLGHMQK
jgi:tight adherence protein C